MDRRAALRRRHRPLGRPNQPGSRPREGRSLRRPPQDRDRPRSGRVGGGGPGPRARPVGSRGRHAVPGRQPGPGRPLQPHRRPRRPHPARRPPRLSASFGDWLGVQLQARPATWPGRAPVDGPPGQGAGVAPRRGPRGLVPPLPAPAGRRRRRGAPRLPRGGDPGLGHRHRRGPGTGPFALRRPTRDRGAARAGRTPRPGADPDAGTFRGRGAQTPCRPRRRGPAGRPPGLAPRPVTGRRRPRLRRLQQQDPRRPRRPPAADYAQLRACVGIGPAKVENYGDDLLALIAEKSG